MRFLYKYHVVPIQAIEKDHFLEVLIDRAMEYLDRGSAHDDEGAA
jgi:hypothetical protein